MKVIERYTMVKQNTQDWMQQMMKPKMHPKDIKENTNKGEDYNRKCPSHSHEWIHESEVKVKTIEGKKCRLEVAKNFKIWLRNIYCPSILWR